MKCSAAEALTRMVLMRILRLARRKVEVSLLSMWSAAIAMICCDSCTNKRSERGVFVGEKREYEYVYHQYGRVGWGAWIL